MGRLPNDLIAYSAPRLVAHTVQLAKSEQPPNNTLTPKSECIGQPSMSPYYFPKQTLQQNSTMPVPTTHTHSRSQELTFHSTSQPNFFLPTENMILQKPSSESSPSKVTRPRITLKQWEEQRSDIEELYIDQGKSLTYTMKFISDKYGNHAKSVYIVSNWVDLT